MDGSPMSTWELLILTAAIAALIGVVVGRVLSARHRSRDEVKARMRRIMQGSVPSADGGMGSDLHVAIPADALQPAPTKVPRNYPVPVMPTGEAPGSRSPIAPSGRAFPGVLMRRTPSFDEPPDRQDATTELRINTAGGEIIRAQPEEGFTIGPPGADLMVPELPARLILGRSGDVWTVQAAGPVDLGVTLDGVPVTSVPMPWTSDRRLTVGALTLTLENAPADQPSFRAPAARVDPEYALSHAASANAYGLVIGRSNGKDASTLVAAALAALDPRILDPARAAALAALNITLAIRDAEWRSARDFSGEPPRVAVLGVDANGKWRAAANFEVSVWAITENARTPLSSHLPEEVSQLEVVPLDLRVATELGEYPTLLLTAGASLDTLSRQLTEHRTDSPEQLVNSLVASGIVAVAAAAVATNPDVLRGDSPRTRTRGAGPRPTV
jgi:hypothetical protein